MFSCRHELMPSRTLRVATTILGSVTPLSARLTPSSFGLHDEGLGRTASATAARPAGLTSHSSSSSSKVTRTWSASAASRLSWRRQGRPALQRALHETPLAAAAAAPTRATRGDRGDSPSNSGELPRYAMAAGSGSAGTRKVGANRPHDGCDDDDDDDDADADAMMILHSLED